MPEASVYRGPLRLAAGTCGGGCKTGPRGSAEAAHGLFGSNCGSAHSEARSQLQRLHGAAGCVLMHLDQ